MFIGSMWSPRQISASLRHSEADFMNHTASVGEKFVRREDSRCQLRPSFKEAYSRVRRGEKYENHDN